MLTFYLLATTIPHGRVLCDNQMNTQRIERAHASMIRKLLVMDLSYLRDVTGGNMDAQKWKLVLSRFFAGEFYILRP